MRVRTSHARWIVQVPAAQGEALSRPLCGAAPGSPAAPAAAGARRHEWMRSSYKQFLQVFSMEMAMAAVIKQMTINSSYQMPLIL